MTKKFALEATNADGTVPFLEAVRNVLVTYKGTVGDPLSLADVAKIARIEPITLISNDLSGVKDLYNILHGVLNIYAAYYLQAISILSAQLQDIRILKILDKTNPDRDIKTMLTAGYLAYESISQPAVNNTTLALQNCKYRLPMLSNNKYAVEDGFSNLFDENTNKLTTSINKLETFEKLGTAIGKVIEVKFTMRQDGEKTNSETTIPVVVKLDTMVIASEVVDAIITSSKDEIRFSSRLKDALSGRISFIKDFLFASDLIKNQKKILMRDNSNTYNAMLKRINNSRMYSALSGNISVAGVSSVYVMTEKNEAEIAKHIGGRLNSRKVREMIFDKTMAMMIVVVDREWERVSIYIRDIDGYSQNSFDSFKSQSDKSNNQMLDIFKAFALGNAPTF